MSSTGSTTAHVAWPPQPNRYDAPDRILMKELTEDHDRTPETLTPTTPYFWAVLSFVVP
jgi:hypothetical protein